MSENVESVTIEILRSIQANISQLRTETSEFRAETNARFERLESGLRKNRRNAAGMLVMVRATAGDFDARVSDDEERVAALESHA